LPSNPFTCRNLTDEIVTAANMQSVLSYFFATYPVRNQCNAKWSCFSLFVEQDTYLWPQWLKATREMYFERVRQLTVVLHCSVMTIFSSCFSVASFR